MSYESMSDFEVNKAVAEACGLLIQEMDKDASLGFTPDFHSKYPNVVWVAELDCSTGKQCEPWWQFDPCNDWGHGGPIIVENKISIVNPYVNSGIWTAFTFDSEEYECEHKNPLRAAMIVYLMMQEGNLSTLQSQMQGN